MIGIADLKGGKRDQPIVLGSDDKPEIHVDAMVFGSTLGVIVTPAISKYVENAAFISVVVDDGGRP